MVEKLLSYLFLKNQIEHIYGSTVWNFINFVFIVCPSGGQRKYIEIRVLTTCFYFTYRKQKEDWNLSPCLIFYIIFQEKFFPCYNILTDQISLSDCLYFLRYWVVCVS